MLIFWSIATLLVAVTLAVLLLPLFSARRKTAAPDANAAALAVYRDQKRALDAELADGVISAEEHEAAVAELSRRLGEDVGAPGEQAPAASPRKRTWLVAAALLVVIPSAAFILYALLGKPDAITSSAGGGNAHEVSDQQILAMVDSLAKRLKTRPDDADGWVLLARSYQSLGRFGEAADAYGHAEALVPDNAELLADYADVLAMAQGRKLSGKPAELATRALAIDPNHTKALALAGTAALEAHDLEAAVGYWRRLQALLPEGSEDARQITAIIAEVESAKSGGKSPPPSAPAPARERTQPAVAASAASNVAITGRVEISAALGPKVAVTDTVFIFARATEGPRMPLAILRIPAKELPKEFRLDDSMGMGSGAKLSAMPTVVVEARISKSGNAMPQAGDLSGKSEPVKPGASGIKITIDQVVP
jgi:cytochrome c-type biogenesis protein CcmH